MSLQNTPIAVVDLVDETPTIAVEVEEHTPNVDANNRNKITPERFERRWNLIVEQFGLEDNEWLNEMYDIRRRWIPVYLLDEPSIYSQNV